MELFCCSHSLGICCCLHPIVDLLLPTPSDSNSLMGIWCYKRRPFISRWWFLEQHTFNYFWFRAIRFSGVVLYDSVSHHYSHSLHCTHSMVLPFWWFVTFVTIDSITIPTRFPTIPVIHVYIPVPTITLVCLTLGTYSTATVFVTDLFAPAVLRFDTVYNSVLPAVVTFSLRYRPLPLLFTAFSTCVYRFTFVLSSVLFVLIRYTTPFSFVAVRYRYRDTTLWSILPHTPAIFRSAMPAWFCHYLEFRARSAFVLCHHTRHYATHWNWIADSFVVRPVISCSSAPFLYWCTILPFTTSVALPLFTVVFDSFFYRFSTVARYCVTPRCSVLMRFWFLRYRFWSFLFWVVCYLHITACVVPHVYVLTITVLHSHFDLVQFANCFVPRCLFRLRWFLLHLISFVTFVPFLFSVYHT